MFEVGERAFVTDDSFEARQFLRFLRRHARFILVVAAAAALLAFAVSLILPKQYTAVARVLIDPPATTDPRTAVVMNPAYLESLRAYELLASSDSLFLRAADQFHLRNGSSGSLDRLKRRILRVALVRDTRVLEIQVTLPDPGQAQSVAQFLADQTIASTRAANQQSDEDLIDAAAGVLQNAREFLEHQQAAWIEFNARNPDQSLQGEIDALVDAREDLQRDLLDSRAGAAEFSEQARVAEVRARIQNLEQQDASLEKRIREKSQQLSGRNALADQLRQRRDAAQSGFDAASARVREMRAMRGTRGERLRIFDPAVAPDRPSSPNVALNVGIAFLAALICAVAYLAVVFEPRRDSE